MMKINEKFKKGIKKKIALFSLLALLLNMVMVGVFVPSENVLRADSVISQAGWSLEYADSEEFLDGNTPGENAFDGNTSTFWGTEWGEENPGHPHEIQIDLGANYDISGFKYLPRQTNLSEPHDDNGRIKGYEFYVSADGLDWGTAVSDGIFINSGNAEIEKTFTETIGSYIRLVALSSWERSDDIPNPWTTVADLNVLGEEILETVCVDIDGDGYGVGDTTNCANPETDCNDSDASINPDAAEICDDVDNNCNGEIDEGCGEDNSATLDVIINEVAWMGTDGGLTNDEWIELRNMTSETIVLDDWTLNAQDGTPSITLEGSILPNEYYLLERSNDDTVLDVTADKIYTGALGDGGEFFELRKADNTLVDKVDASSGWQAGVKTEPKYPMELCADYSWYDSDVAGGTPRAENSCSGVCVDSDGDGVCDGDDNCPNISNPLQEDADSDGVGDACDSPDPVCGNEIVEGAEECDDGNLVDGDGCSASCKLESGDNIFFGDLIINELMWMGSALSPTGDEWIELRNRTDSEVDLSSCHLTKIGSNGEELMLSIPEGSLIPTFGYYLISNYSEENSNISVEPDLVDTSVALSNNTLKVTLYCGGDTWEESSFIDWAGDGGTPLAGDNDNPKKSMARKYASSDGSSADNWCTASTAVNWDEGKLELGTPGVVNYCEGDCVDTDGDGVCDEEDNCPDTSNPDQEDTDDDGIGDVCEEAHSQCSDNDGDGYGTGDTANCSYLEEDCNDSDASINPGATEICGNGIDEDCDGADTSCDDPAPVSTGGGGGGYVGGLAISNESIKNAEVSEDDIKITWTTSQFSTSQVIYDIEPGKFDLNAGAPNYGYAYSKEGDDSGLDKVTGHSVTLTGLNPMATYYYRTVSSASPPVFGPEKSFVTLAMEETTEEIKKEDGEVKGTEAPAPTSPSEECNYLLEYIKLGADNNPVEVEKVERFLNEFEGENLVVNGIYEQVDFDAVSRFQKKYIESVLAPWGYDKATGYVYITTKKKINELYCQKELPLTAEQEAEVALFSERMPDALNESVEASGDSGEDLTSKDTFESSETENKEDISGRVGGVEDKTDESEDETTEDKLEAEIGTEEKAEETEDKNEITIQDVQEENGDDSEYAGDRYSKYLPAFIIIIIIVGGAWYFFYRKKGKEETK